MIQAIPGKARYQVFMDHALPGHFEFMDAFANAQDAEHHAKQLHVEYLYSDTVVLDAHKGSLLMTLPGKRTLTGSTI